MKNDPPQARVQSAGLNDPVSVTKAVAAAGNYTAEDVISESASAGTPWQFDDLISHDGGNGYITRAHVIIETTSQVQALALYLFTATPTSELDDNKANTALVHADLANYVGRIDFPILSENGGDSESVATPSTAGNLPLPFKCAENSRTLYGILVTVDAFTNETATDDYTVRLQAEDA